MPSDKYIRGQIGSNIEKLARVLSKYEIVRDVGPLYNAASQCRDYKTREMWGYEFDNLIFNRMGNLKRLPSSVEKEDISLRLSISTEGKCHPKEYEDPLSKLEFFIWIEGQCIGDSGEIETPSCAWHLDRHISAEKKGTNPPEFMHPCYHFHFGGRHFESLFVNKALPVLLLDSPRIAHPPLEAILGVDFILTNFIGSNLLGFRNEGEYSSMIREMQKSIWKPYIIALSNTLDISRKTEIWNPSIVWPQLI